jgi:hypothetical protein
MSAITSPFKFIFSKSFLGDLLLLLQLAKDNKNIERNKK